MFLCGWFFWCAGYFGLIGLVRVIRYMGILSKWLCGFCARGVFGLIGFVGFNLIGFVFLAAPFRAGVKRLMLLVGLGSSRSCCACCCVGLGAVLVSRVLF